MATPRFAREPDVDAEFLEHRAKVVAYLRRYFPSVDPEDVYQEAWIEAVKLRRRGVPIANVEALLMDTARNRAIDLVRKRVAIPVPETGALMATTSDPSPPPDEVIATRLEAARIRRIVENIGPREALIIAMRFDLGMPTREITARLGITRNRLNKTVNRIYRVVLEEIDEDESGEAHVTKRQRSLLLTCLWGHASEAQLAKARAEIAKDPMCGALLAHLRETMERVAVALPAPVLLEGQREHGIGVVDQLNQSAATLRDLVTVAAPRVSGQSWFEPLTGSLATLGTAGAAKVIVICLSLGSGAAVCIHAGVFGRDDPAGAVAATARPAKKVAKEERPARVRPRQRIVRPAPAAKVVRTSKPAVVHKQTVNDPPAPSPAPPGSEEFGVGTVGSQPASNVPAAAPTDGGGEFLP